MEDWTAPPILTKEYEICMSVIEERSHESTSIVTPSNNDQDHELLHSTTSSSPVHSLPGQKGKGYKFECKLCHMKFKERYKLHRHRLTHTGEKPH